MASKTDKWDAPPAYDNPYMHIPDSPFIDDKSNNYLDLTHGTSLNLYHNQVGQQHDIPYSINTQPQSQSNATPPIIHEHLFQQSHVMANGIFSRTTLPDPPHTINPLERDLITARYFSRAPFRQFYGVSHFALAMMSLELFVVAAIVLGAYQWTHGLLRDDYNDVPRIDGKLLFVLCGIVVFLYGAAQMFSAFARTTRFHSDLNKEYHLSPLHPENKMAGMFDALLYYRMFLNPCNEHLKDNIDDDDDDDENEEQDNNEQLPPHTRSIDDEDLGLSIAKRREMIKKSLKQQDLTSVDNFLQAADNDTPMLYFAVHCFDSQAQADLYAEYHHSKREWFGEIASFWQSDEKFDHACHLYPIIITSASNLSPQQLSNDPAFLQTLRNGDLIEFRSIFSLTNSDQDWIEEMKQMLINMHRKPTDDDYNNNISPHTTENQWGVVQVDLVYVLHTITPQKLSPLPSYLRRLKTERDMSSRYPQFPSDIDFEEFAMPNPLGYYNKFYVAGCNNPSSLGLLLDPSINILETDKELECAAISPHGVVWDEVPIGKKSPSSPLTPIITSKSSLHDPLIQSNLLLDEQKLQLELHNDNDDEDDDWDDLATLQSRMIYKQSGYTGFAIEYYNGFNLMQFFSSRFVWFCTIFPGLGLLMTLLSRFIYGPATIAVYHHKQLTLERKVILPDRCY